VIYVMKMKIRIPVLMVLLFVLSNTVSCQSSSSTELVPTNVVVDFDSTTMDSSLSAGDSGIMNLVIENNGGRRGENIEVYLPSTGVVSIDKRFYIGKLEAGESKTFPVLVRVKNDAVTGLSAVNVRIKFDGFNYAGMDISNQLTTWNVPFRVYGKPSFQITPAETTYFKDTLGELVLEGMVLDPVKNLEATLSSSCITVIGSSRRYLGAIGAGKSFKINYPIKPTAAGACSASLLLQYTDESGSSATDNVTLGLNIDDAGIDFKIINISYEPTGPGETVSMLIGLKNVGKADSKDTTLSLSLSEPFVPVDTSEKYLGTVSAGQYVETQFDISVSWDAEIKAYAIPMTIFYKVGGMTYNVSKSIGIDVGGSIILEIMNIDTSRGNVRIEVANIGTRAADGVKATLEIPSGGSAVNASGRPAGFQRPGMNATGGRPARNATMAGGGVQSFVSYKSDIKANKQTTFTFDTTATGPATLKIEYTGLNNRRVTETERITLGSGRGFSSFRSRQTTASQGTSYTTYAIYLAVAAVLILAARKFYRGMKSG
jgi:hypothetical protein